MDKRATAPAIQSMIRPKAPLLQKETLSNGLPLYELRAGTQNIIKVELLFRAGRPFELKKQVARFTNHLMREGSKSKTAAEIAEEIDYYGASLGISESLDHAGFTLFTLKKHLNKVLPVWMDILLHPSFMEDEIERFRKNALEKLSHDLSKNDFVAFREITSIVFGDDNMYGYNSSEERIKLVQREDLVSHYSRCYTANNGLAIVSGKTDDKIMDMIRNALSLLPSGELLDVRYPLIQELDSKRHIVPSKNKHQLALRLGKRCINRKHADFPGLYVLNTILGGYFGSRLMSNIREEKGYTYNIYSSLDTMLYDGACIIAMETDPSYLEDSFRQIYKELDQLCQHKIEEEELQMVKNYLLGYLLTALDGPLHASELIKSFLLEDQDLNDFEHLVDVIFEIDQEELRNLAQRYLQGNSFKELVVGI